MKSSARTDRQTLRLACREGVPCVVLRPGRPGWGRSFLVDLRDDGPRPQLSVAQPVDLGTGEAAPLGVGETARIWSVHDVEPWQVQGHVGSVGVVESRGFGPVHAARLTLPWRLQASERRLRPRMGPALRVAVETADDPAPRTLLETWTSPSSEPMRRGPAWLVELSRASLTYSVPLEERRVLLPGSRVQVSVSVGEPVLAVRLPARVEVVFELAEQLLYGLSLGGPVHGSADEHREVMRRAGV